MWSVTGLFLLGMLPCAAFETQDLHGYPLPAGAVQRLGTLAMRYSSVGGLAYLPDGRGIVFAGGYVDIWDLQEGVRQSRTLVASSPLVSVHVRSDGQALLLAESAGFVHEWNSQTKQKLRSWDTGQRELRTACYSPDGRRVLTAANNPPGAKEWDLATGQELIALKSDLAHMRAGAIYGPGGDTAILGGGYTHNLEHWDLRTGQLLKKWCAIYEAKHMALSPDEKYVIVGVEDRAVEWALDIYQIFRHYKHCPGEAARIYSVAYLAQTNEVLCGGRDGTIHRWSRQTGEREFSWRPHQSIVAPMAVSPDEQWLLSFGSGLVAETNIRTGAPRLPWDRHLGSIEAVAFMPDNRRAVTASSDETLRIWDVGGGKTLHVIKGAALGAYAVAVSEEGRYVAAGCKDGKLRVFEAASGQLLRELAGHLGYIRAVAFDKNGRIYSSADDGTIRIWEHGTPEAVIVLRGHRGGVLGLDVSPEGKILVSGGRDGTWRLWDVATGKPLQECKGHAGYVTAVCFAPDARFIFTGGRDGHLKKWETQTGQAVWDVSQGAWINALACSPDGERICVGSAEGRICVYDARTGAAKISFSHGSPVLSLAVSPNSQWLLSGAQDTTALLWRLQP